MKKTIIFGVIFLLTGLLNSFFQVSISRDNSPPDSSAMLDVQSTTQGMLVPRMTEVQRGNISNPATGLLIFSTTNNRFYSNQGTPGSPNWVMLNSQWITTGSNIYYTTGNVGTGNTNPVQKLQVTGNVAATVGSSSSASFVFGNGSENTGFSSPVGFTIGFIINGSFVTTGATGTAIGTGESNTVTIITVQGDGTYAAQNCDNLSLNGKSDWFLPSKDELSQMYSKRSTIGGFGNSTYWSSSEVDNGNAWVIDFGTSALSSDSKANLYLDRCIRKF